MLDRRTTPFDSNDAERIAREHFGVDGRATALTSERDQNFLIARRTAGASCSRSRTRPRIARCSTRSSARSRTSRQRSRRRRGSCPRRRIDARRDSAADGKRISSGRSRGCRASRSRPSSRRSPELYEDFGRQVGALDAALRRLRPSGDPSRLLLGSRERRASIVESQPHADHRRDASARDRHAHRRSSTTRTAPLLADLPRAAIHSDLNDHNVLVGGVDDDVERRGQRVTGIVDFGDMVHSYRVGDLAIAIAYAMLGSDDPLTVASRDGARLLPSASSSTDDELDGAVRARRAAAVRERVHRRRADSAQRPDNAYLGVSQAAIRETLAAARRRFRSGSPKRWFATRPASAPCRASEARRRVSRATRRSRRCSASISRREPTIVLDLSIASPLLERRRARTPSRRSRDACSARCDDAGVACRSVGTTSRGCSTSRRRSRSGPTSIDEHRTIHIGLDLFADAGTPVYAPLDGVVHAFADNAIAAGLRSGDHPAPRDGRRRRVLHALRTSEPRVARRTRRRPRGRRRRADRDARQPDVNGGWTPHLHLQVITDLLGLGTDFPGVARPSQRRAWMRALSRSESHRARSGRAVSRRRRRRRETLAARARTSAAISASRIAIR